MIAPRTPWGPQGATTELEGPIGVRLNPSAGYLSHLRSRAPAPEAADSELPVPPEVASLKESLEEDDEEDLWEPLGEAPPRVSHSWGRPFGKQVGQGGLPHGVEESWAALERIHAQWQ